VVKVERPEGDGLRAVMKQGLVAQTGDFDFLVEQVNRNKRNVCLDLKHPDSRPVLERLVAWADVFITNQLPQVRRKLRIEPEDLRALNPRLICARARTRREGPTPRRAATTRSRSGRARAWATRCRARPAW
jgi:crotonobetainyl-CoA:carnitine CoA-transferase CaiB-like acyl-CoA transferase